MSEHRVYRMLPYARQLVKLAVCDVLEQEGCLDFVRDGPGGAILADVTVYGNPGRFSIAVRDGPAGTELSVSITAPGAVPGGTAPGGELPGRPGGAADGKRAAAGAAGPVRLRPGQAPQLSLTGGNRT